MNLIVEKENKLENLEKRTTIRPLPVDDERRYNRYQFPWRRFYRFLNSRLGEPINKVISEIVRAEWIPARFRTVEQIKDYVEFNTFMIEGKVYYHSNYSYNPLSVDSVGRFVFYVHPQTKLLCRGEKIKTINYKEKRDKEREKVLKVLGPYHQFAKVGGLWFEIKAKPKQKCYTSSWVKSYRPDDFLGNIKKTFWTNVEIICRRQLGSKELKQNNLKNDIVISNGNKCNICGGSSYCVHKNKS